ncbi:hypothetical protein [Pseudolysinimonas sp.]|jgi:hypothetical protein|uniref:hypothetical protein n=1 Tax=Pseudolysinimonas sp. TaxID=2680009 RepID=UPI003784757D
MTRRSTAILAIVLLLAGCTSAPTPADQAWVRVPLPADVVGSQVLVIDGRLVVGGSRDEQPALLVADAAGVLAPIPIEAVSYYGALARWSSISAEGSHLRALGGRTGGGHGNPRWSTWVGDLNRLTEQPVQGLEVFGGWRGGGMVGVTEVDGQAVLVGGRAGGGPGLDIAIWLEHGDSWIEQSSTGSPLAATADVLPFATSVVTDDHDLLVTGFTQRLGGGEVRVEAAAWVGGPTGPWELLDLPHDALASQAEAAWCEGGRCVIVGRGDGLLLAWSYVDGAATQFALPRIEASDEIPAPVLWDGATALVGAGVIAVSEDASSWRLIEGPEGDPLAAAAFGGVLYVLTVAADGSVTLWQSA